MDATPAETGRAQPTGQALWSEVERYMVDMLLPADPVLERTLASSEAAGLPPIAVSPNQGKLLALLTRLHGARTILELGTLGAYSTIWLARALPAAGRLLTMEANPAYAQVAAENIEASGLGDVVELRVGKALELLPQLHAERPEPFDLVFIDADKQNTAAYFDWALRLTRAGSVIVVDNVVRGGAILDPAAAQPGGDPAAQGMRRFYERLAAEAGITATAIQTVGSKGHDGFAVALVTRPGTSSR